MTSHISDELPLLLSGEASRQAVLDAAAHLRNCEDCRQELVSAVVAHASLASAQRFAPEIMTALREPVGTDQPQQLPDLSEIFQQVRRESAQGPKQSRRVPRFAVAAAAAALIVGGGGVVAVEQLHGSSSPGTSIALSAFGSGHTAGQAKLVGSDSMKITATSLPKLSATQRYEVWLTNSARTRMQPVGWIGTSGKAQLTIPPNLMQAYNAIEVSVQSVDASTYDYSGDSVLRGTYRS